jgi:hypothetical protein
MDLNLTAEELLWLQKENMIPNLQLNKMKAKDAFVQNWIKQLPSSSHPIILSESPPKPINHTRKKIKNERCLIGEIGCTAISLSRGKNLVSVDDDIILVRSKQAISAPKKNFWASKKSLQKESIVRLKNNRTGSEFGKLTLEHSVFISTLIDLSICEFDAKIIYCPADLNIMDEIILTLRVYLKPAAFFQTLQNLLEKPQDED